MRAGEATSTSRSAGFVKGSTDTMKRTPLARSRTSVDSSRQIASRFESERSAATNDVGSTPVVSIPRSTFAKGERLSLATPADQAELVCMRRTASRKLGIA